MIAARAEETGVSVKGLKKEYNEYKKRKHASVSNSNSPDSHIDELTSLQEDFYEEWNDADEEINFTTKQHAYNCKQIKKITGNIKED